MNILEGIKSGSTKPMQTTNSTKFIIKSKPSVKENRATEGENEINYASNQDVHQLITYIINKSKRLAELLDSKGIANLAEFHNTHLYQNPCVKTFLKSIMDKMLAERRLGKSLKGINKGILNQIENSIWQAIEREVTLYQLDKMYAKQKETLEQQLFSRRRQIEKQIELLQTENLQADLVFLQETDQNIAT